MGFIIGIAVLVWIIHEFVGFRQQTNKTLSELKNQIASLSSQIKSKPTNIDTPYTNQDIPNTKALTQAIEIPRQPIAELRVEAPKVAKAEQVKQTPSITSDIERQIGTRLPVWIGSISLIFAAFYMIQYSIEIGLLSPAVRLTISALFGVVLMIASLWVIQLQKIANGKIIAQGLAGAGIAALYLSIYAATSIYPLLSLADGFIGMGVVTAVSIILALKHGAPIALISMLSGFLTPVLLHGAANTLLLFVYLYIVLFGMFLIIRKNNWWNLAVLTILACFIWAFSWAILYPLAENSLVLGMFVIAVSVTFFIMSNKNTDQTYKQLVSVLGLVFLAFITYGAQYTIKEWSMYGFIAIATIILAYLDPITYKKSTWISLFLSALMVYNWDTLLIADKLTVIISFGLLFTVSGYVLSMIKNTDRVNWLLLSAVSNIVFYMLSYIKIKVEHQYSPDAWVNIAYLCLVFWTFSGWMMNNKVKDQKEIIEKIVGICCFTAVTFVATIILLVFDKEYYAIAFAAELLFVSWLSTRVQINKLDVIVTVLLMAFVASMVNQFGDNPLMFEMEPILYLGLPGILIGAASIFCKKSILDTYSQFMEVVAIILLTLAGIGWLSYIINTYYSFTDINSKYLLHGLVYNFCILLGVACVVFVGNKYKRIASENTGYTWIILSCAYILVFDVLDSSMLEQIFFNDQYNYQNINIGSIPIFNSLLLPYLFPALWLVIAQKHFKPSIARLVMPFSAVLTFVWVSLIVRQYFHGTCLTVGVTTNIEIYMYSIMWLIFGVGVLIFGTWLKNKSMRMGSLFIILAAIFKVFLYDAAALTGVLRVISFLGLGFSLIAISWFYARFVFKQPAN